MSAEMHTSELLSDDNTGTETYGDYIAKYRTLHQQIVSAAIFGDQTLKEIAREHSVSERCIRNLIQEYSQIPIPRELVSEYQEMSKRKRCASRV